MGSNRETYIQTCAKATDEARVDPSTPGCVAEDPTGPDKTPNTQYETKMSCLFQHTGWNHQILMIRILVTFNF